MKISDITERCGLSEQESAELSGYIANRFEGCTENDSPDSSFIEAWNGIMLCSSLFGAAKAINEKICPLRQTQFRSPEGVKMEIYDSFAGKIPAIYVRDPEDFEQLVTNIVHKGVRPANISKTGASFIYGKSTRFMVLSFKPYSNVPADELGLKDDDWAERSLILRRGHECTHFFTKQTYGITNNILHDELIADLIGMYEAFGFYKAEWFLRFMGIVSGSGGRMVYYTEGLSEKSVKALSEIMTAAAYSLEEWSRSDDFARLGISGRIKTLCLTGLSGIAEGRFILP